MIPCKQDKVIVDWSSGVLKTHIGESNINRTRAVRDGREPNGVSTREEEMLGKYFVLPPGKPPPPQWRVLDDCAVNPGGNYGRLPSIVQELNASSTQPAILVAGRDPVQPSDLVLPSLVQELNASSTQPANLVAGRDPVQPSELVLPSLVQELNASLTQPANLVAGRDPVQPSELVLLSLAQENVVAPESAD